jgi:hypothetical protein
MRAKTLQRRTHGFSTRYYRLNWLSHRAPEKQWQKPLRYKIVFDEKRVNAWEIEANKTVPRGDCANKSLSRKDLQHKVLVPACREPFVLHDKATPLL